MQLDTTSLRLLDLLLRDGRMPVSELARCLNRSEASIRERMDRLEEEGVIRGYVADVDPARVGLNVSAIVRATADLRRHRDLAKALQRIPNVTGAEALGEDGFVRIKVLARTSPELQALVQQDIAPLGLKSAETFLVLEEIVESRPPRLEELFQANPMSEESLLSA